MKNHIKASVFGLLFGLPAVLSAQTDSDGLKMSKNNFCGGLTYTYSYWDDYWEGTFRRDNENIGRLSTSMVSVMGAYGLFDRLNLIFSLPYVMTGSSEGTLKGQRGIQDFSLFLKWLALRNNTEQSSYRIYGVLGGSTPVTNYIADFLPMSIGLRSTGVNFRLIGDYQFRQFFVTASANYVHRFNITIDRDAYYTESMIYSNEVFMPNAFSSKVGLGYRKGELVIEGIIDHWNTLGGFDIRKNDMPFPSNNMDMTRTGINLKVPVEKSNRLLLIGNSFYTIKGRNVGQTVSGTVGVFYIFSSRKNQRT